MFLVGLSGGIATGKSTVAKIFEAAGVPVIDADAVARSVVEPGKTAWFKIRKEFGESVFNEDGTLNRAKLGEIIFSNPDKRMVLNKITHPYIQRAIIFQVLVCFFKGFQFAVLDLPLLFETGVFMEYIYKTIVVYCDKDLQLERLIKRNQYSKEEAEKRIAAQMPLDEKCRRANFVIDNNGTLAETNKQTQIIYNMLHASRAQWRVRLLLVGCISLIGIFSMWIYTNIPPKH